MKQNVGLINAIIRITAGFTVLAWATSKLVRRPYRSTPLLAAMLGALSVAEGITRYCPLTDLFEDKIGNIRVDTAEQNELKLYETINPS
ncbi:DUF2892 domain-containing protein [Anaerobacillus sp. MEB173]|uniref:YgaP family membrane protein n=1 Tax=Anaerobacillus sp. MEB173 TaxID=3383345 RepID=UPI003F8E3CEE